MALPFDPVWAVNGPVRAPSAGEQDEGFPCGELDRDLFNFMFQDLQQAINASYLRSGAADIPVNGWQNTPPGSPSIGDKYIVNTAPTGAWVGHATEIAIWSGDAWVFGVPEAALQVQFRRNSLQVILEFDGTAWAEARYVRQISVGPTIYVRTDGNDANDGSSNDAGHAFATIKAAVQYGTRAFFLVGQTLTIKLGNTGSYACPGAIAAGGAFVDIVGDVAAPGSYQLVGPLPVAGQGMLSCNLGAVKITGVQINNNYAGSASIIAGGSGNVTVDSVLFSQGAGGVTACMQASSGGNLNMSSGCQILGDVGSVFLAIGGSKISISGNLYLPSGLTFNTFAFAGALSLIQRVGGATISTTATGVRYAAVTNSVIDTSGGGANFFPGTSAGTVASGAQYV